MKAIQYVRHLLLLFSSIVILTSCKKTDRQAENINNVYLSEKPQLRVPFISKTPIIDGVIDKNLSHLEAQEFNYIWQFDNPKTDTVKVSYRMAYTPKHLYLYIETETDSISYHRRGYLWGDGYKILLGMPQKDSLTNEYYELSFSPTLEKEYEWDKQRIMYYNFDQVTKKLSKETISQEKAEKGISGFEALIAWDDIKPYHPWFVNRMGYNVYFAKGIEHKEHGYITNGYSLVEDEGIWDEEIPKRNYNLISFEKPKYDDQTIIISQPKKQNLLSGEPVFLNVSSIGKKDSKIPLAITIRDESRKIMYQKKIDHFIQNVLTHKEYQLKLNNFSTGKYTLEMLANSDVETFELSILPDIPYNELETKIVSNPNQISQNAINTLLFKLQELKQIKDNIKYYETGLDLIEKWQLFKKELKQFENGQNPYLGITSPHRRAFRSKYDNTLQPYSIKLPQNFDANKNYPLLVFLHGSGQDEQYLLNKNRSNGEFIELAPFARDKFRAYAEDYSQKDIIEAIEDVKKHFNIAHNKIIIGGFSMGGYGALRTFYEHPELYKGVAIFAGHPNLANEWLDGEYPNFLEDKFLGAFQNVPVFIYHGKKDAGLDVNLIEQMSDKLKQNGAKVTKSIVKDKGHEYQDEKPMNSILIGLIELLRNKY